MFLRELRASDGRASVPRMSRETALFLVTCGREYGRQKYSTVPKRGSGSHPHGPQMPGSESKSSMCRTPTPSSAVAKLSVIPSHFPTLEIPALPQMISYQHYVALFAAVGSTAYGYSASIIAYTIGHPSFFDYMGLVNGSSRANSIIGAANGLFGAGLSIWKVLHAFHNNCLRCIWQAGSLAA
jgi:hypothetical protein